MANEKAQAKSLEETRKLMQQFATETEGVVAELKDEIDRLGDAASSVNESWSQSSIGHHGSYYYGEFEPVPGNNRWSVEWGTVHGVPDGWRARSGDEVKAEVESRAGGLKIQDFSRKTQEYMKAAQKLKGEVEIELSDFEFTPGMEKEKELFTQLEGYDFGDIDQLRADYINARVGGRKASRDSEAIMAGTYVPAHMTTSAGVSVAEHIIDSSQKFLELGERFVRQTEKKVGIVRATPATELDALTRVLKLLARFHSIAQQLLERHDSRSTLVISDEYDVQDLLHAVLRIEFDDVRAEEWTPSYAGSSARMDFLLKNEEIVVEVKKTNAGLKDKQIGEQLILDIAHYKAHQNCKTLVCFIYDPGSLVKNKAGLIGDLQKMHDGLDVKVIFIP